MLGTPMLGTPTTKTSRVGSIWGIELIKATCQC